MKNAITAPTRGLASETRKRFFPIDFHASMGVVDNDLGSIQYAHTAWVLSTLSKNGPEGYPFCLIVKGSFPVSVELRKDIQEIAEGGSHLVCTLAAIFDKLSQHGIELEIEFPEDAYEETANRHFAADNSRRFLGIFPKRPPVHPGGSGRLEGEYVTYEDIHVRDLDGVVDGIRLWWLQEAIGVKWQGLRFDT